MQNALLILAIILLFLTILLILNYDFRFKINQFYQAFKTKIFVKKLNNIGYFTYSSLEEKQNLISALKLCSNNGQKTDKLFNSFTFKYDTRTFIIEETIDENLLLIDKIGRYEKFNGLVLNYDDLNNNNFISFCSKIGLNLLLNNKIVFKENSEVSVMEYSINNKIYKIKYPYLEDEFLIYEFVKSLNDELSMIKSDEQFYLYNSFPTILILANKKIFEYINKGNIELQNVDNWLNKYNKKNFC